MTFRSSFAKAAVIASLSTSACSSLPTAREAFTNAAGVAVAYRESTVKYYRPGGGYGIRYNVKF